MAAAAGVVEAEEVAEGKVEIESMIADCIELNGVCRVDVIVGAFIAADFVEGVDVVLGALVTT
jgi:hypothetical protein